MRRGLGLDKAEEEEELGYDGVGIRI